AVTDDFVFATPQQLRTVPVPSTLLLLAVPLLILLRRYGTTATYPLVRTTHRCEQGLQSLPMTITRN
ncbi:MAG TPA: hypothetical protein VK663_12215, partial [Burkholderiales bacterium]|nr:hypothetical protein [Burkholderiales bacterium]